MVLVYTGDGKGKTTASLGLCVRATGNGLKTAVVQFLKSPDYPTGESEFLRKAGIEIHTMGVGFTWTKGADVQLDALAKAWELSKAKLRDTSYDLIILDEINNVFATSDFDWRSVMPMEEVLTELTAFKGERNAVLTGRGAPPELISFADLATEMRPIKHYYDSGAKAARGLEF